MSANNESYAVTERATRNSRIICGTRGQPCPVITTSLSCAMVFTSVICAAAAAASSVILSAVTDEARKTSAASVEACTTFDASVSAGAALLREEVLQFLGQSNLHWRCHGRFRISGTVFRGVEGLTGRALALDFAS